MKQAVANIKDEFPVAVLRPEDMQTLQTSAQSVWLSRETLVSHLEKHPEIRLADYQRIPEILDRGEVYLQGDSRLIFYRIETGITERRSNSQGTAGKTTFLPFLKQLRNRR